MEQNNIFSIPIYSFKNPNHQEDKIQIMNYLSNEDVFVKTKTTSQLFYTKPDLYTLPEFKSISAYINSCVEKAIVNLGFLNKFQMTGLWASKHEVGTSHHPHIHRNSFLSGIYYLHGNAKHAGTRFKNPIASVFMIMPAVDITKKQKFYNFWTNPFNEGTLIIFPSWLEHSTNVDNNSTTGNERHVLSFNIMPVGVPNYDILERFNYKEVSNSEMINDHNQIHKVNNF